MQGSRTRLVLTSAALAFAALVVMPAAALAGGIAPPSPASPNTHDTQTIYVVMLVITGLLALAVFAALVRAIRGGGAAGPERRTVGTPGIQRRVGAALGLLAVAVFVLGIVYTEKARKVDTPGAEPLEILATGQQWLWRYSYPIPEGLNLPPKPGIFSYYQLVVPVDTPVVVNLQSTDVLHRWWVPALSGAFDAVPGSSNTTWFKADEVGTYDGRSTEYSGPGFSAMRTQVRVVTPDEYQAWITQQAADLQEAQATIQKSVDAGTAPGVAGT